MNKLNLSNNDLTLVVKMTQTAEPQVTWSQDKMVEIRLNEPDDFLKVRETLTRIGVLQERKEVVSIMSYSAQTG